MWVLSPVFAIALGCSASFSPPSFNMDVRLALGELALPFAAWIGSRYGQSGFRFMAVILLPILIGVKVNLFEGIYTIGLGGPLLGTYIAALLICRLFGERRYREACLRADRIDARAVLFVTFTLLCQVGLNLDGDDLTRMMQRADCKRNHATSGAQFEHPIAAANLHEAREQD